jgi:hypothetical protein
MNTHIRTHIVRTHLLVHVLYIVRNHQLTVYASTSTKHIHIHTYTHRYSAEGSSICLPGITDSLFMLASGIQTEVQKGLQWLNTVNVAEVSDSLVQWISSVNIGEISESVAGAAMKAVEYLLDWICAELFNGSAENCFGNALESGQSDSESGSERQTFGRFRTCTAEKVMKRMQGLQVYQTFQSTSRRIIRSHKGSAEDCRDMKKAVKRLFLLMHPDKFNADHSECPKDASVKATMIISMTYKEAKSKCT